jgi:ankyrin repeat protein
MLMPCIHAQADPSTVKLLNRGCYSAMHLAIRRGAGRALQEVEFLLKAGAEVNTRNIRGEVCIALHYSIL